MTDSTEHDQLRRLADAGVHTDANEPFSDQTWVDLRAGRGIVVTTGPTDSITGAAVLIPGRNADSPHMVEAIVDPALRGQGLGTDLLNRLADSGQFRDLQGNPDTSRRVTAWSHGDHPAARALADATGLNPVRELWRMALPVTAPSTAEHQDSFENQGSDFAVQPPQGVRFRTFVPGADDQGWLELNSKAFADHPEQGQLQRADLRARQHEDWFDPAGFFLAENTSDGKLVGFHWTKRPVGAAEGEVYAVGVHPDAQGTGLGRALTLHGMNHLVHAGVERIVLYVDAENTAATGLYNSLGFTIDNIDVMFSGTTLRTQDDSARSGQCEKSEDTEKSGNAGNADSADSR